MTYFCTSRSTFLLFQFALLSSYPRGPFYCILCFTMYYVLFLSTYILYNMLHTNIFCLLSTLFTTMFTPGIREKRHFNPIHVLYVAELTVKLTLTNNFHLPLTLKIKRSSSSFCFSLCYTIVGIEFHAPSQLTKYVHCNMMPRPQHRNFGSRWGLHQ